MSSTLTGNPAEAPRRLSRPSLSASRHRLQGPEREGGAAREAAGPGNRLEGQEVEGQAGQLEAVEALPRRQPRHQVRHQRRPAAQASSTGQPALVHGAHAHASWAHARTGRGPRGRLPMEYRLHHFPPRGPRGRLPRRGSIAGCAVMPWYADMLCRAEDTDKPRGHAATHGHAVIAAWAHVAWRPAAFQAPEAGQGTRRWGGGSGRWPCPPS